MVVRRAVGVLVVVVALCVSSVGAASAGLSLITSADLKDWLSYIASDELQGRTTFGAGYGLAAAFVEDHLRAWGAKPAGDHGSYLQTVRILGVKTTSHASVTVTVKGESRTFADGEGITLPKNMGGRQRVTVDRVLFAGYGLDAPLANHSDYQGQKVKGAAVVWLGAAGPAGIDQSYRRLLGGRNRYATEQMGAAASIGVASGGFGAGREGGSGQPPGPAAAAAAQGGGRGGAIP